MIHRTTAILCTIAALAWALVGCDKPGPSPAPPAASGPRDLRIAAASSLKPALTELAAAFQTEHPAIKVSATYGASGNLYSQLANRAPFDLFLSADTMYPMKLAESGLGVAPRTFARGTLVVWVPKASTLDPAAAKLGILASPDIKHIAIANPQHAPYGKAAEAAMKAAGVYEASSGKLVLGENVEQTAQFGQSGAAEVAFLPLSLALSLGDRGRYAPVPADLYAPIEHGMVCTAWTPHPDDVAAFMRFVTDARGRDILARHGLTGVER